MRARHQRILVYHAIAQGYRSIAAVRNDVQCTDIRSTLEEFVNLVDAGSVAVQHHDFDDAPVFRLRKQIGKQQLDIRRSGVDDHKLTKCFAFRYRLSRGGIVGGLAFREVGNMG